LRYFTSLKISARRAQALVLSSDSTVYVSCFNQVLQAAFDQGAGRNKLLTQVGIGQDTLNTANARLPIALLLELYRLADSTLLNPDLGLNVGRISFFQGLNLHLYMTTICRNLKEYLNVIPSVIKLRGDLGRVIIKPDGDYIRLEWHPLDSSTNSLRYLADEMLSSSALIVGSICTRPVPVYAAEFCYSAPDKLDALIEAFGPRLSFDSGVSCLYFRRDCLRFPLINLGYELGVEFEAAPRSLLQDADTEDSFLSYLGMVMRRTLPTGSLSIDGVSTDMGISRRTLQRRLTARDTSFKNRLQSLREELSLRYLADPRLSITETAFLLGYSDQASFSNAFRAWHGSSPSEYRSLG
jgi:AraC-like DNA-binding protein